MKNIRFYGLLVLLLEAASSVAQQQQMDSGQAKPLKNIIRYNLSGALLFGFDSYIVLGYERVLSPKRSFSINFGKASLPKIVAVSTDSFSIDKEGKRTGFNVSADYRFYLSKENKFDAPRGVYIGPYYSFSKFENTKKFTHKNRTNNNEINTTSNFNIHTVGFELGYQFIFWKRFALDLVLAGPGVGFYKYKAKFSGNLTMNNEEREQLLDGLKQLLVQKFPGMNYVFSDKEIDADGVLTKSDIGYRYLVHIGFNF